MSLYERLKVGEVFNTNGHFSIVESGPEANLLKIAQDTYANPETGWPNHPYHASQARVEENREKFGVGLNDRWVKVVEVNGDWAELVETDDKGIRKEDGLRLQIDMSKMPYKPEVLKAA